jgi:hypothetical protein
MRPDEPEDDDEDFAADDAGDADGNPRDDGGGVFPACPNCGDEGAACEHVFAVVAGGDELLAAMPEYGDLDDLVVDIQRLTLDGDAALSEMARRKDGWWLTPRGQGFGHSGRLAGAEKAAERLGLRALPAADGEQSVYYADDCETARERLRNALVRLKRDLTTLARRLGHEP